MPVRINSKWRFESFPTSSVSNSRSRVMIWDALATESLGRPVARSGRSTLPGASAQRRLLVKETQTTVLIRLRFRASPWTTRTGLRKPAPDPVGSGRLAQYTWPWAITIRRLQGCVPRRPKWLDRAACLLPHRLCSSPRLPLRNRGARYIRSRLPCKPGFATSSAVGTTARLRRKLYREWRSLFSYPKYNPLRVGLQLLRCLHRQGSQTAKPAELSKQPTRFELVINFKTAKQIAVTIPPNVLAESREGIK